MFAGTRVIDSDGHVMEPDALYETYLDSKFRPQLDELILQKNALHAKNFFGIFQKLDTGRPLGVIDPNVRLTRAGRRPRAEPARVRVARECKWIRQSSASFRSRCRARPGSSASPARALGRDDRRRYR